MRTAANLHRTCSSTGSRADSDPTARARKYSHHFGKRPKCAVTQNPLQSGERKPDGSGLNETVRLAQQGDAAAFEALYQLHSRRVYSLCLRMLNDPVEAEDLTQEAFLQLFRKIHTFRGESAFSSWLHRLTANLVLMRFRKKKPVTTSLDEPGRNDDEKSGSPFEIGVLDPRLAGIFDRVNLQSALEQLPEGYRSMFILHDVHGYEHNEIANMLGCSIGNSKSQLHKARKRLRELLDRASSRPGQAYLSPLLTPS